jgi:large subunit ribosomal protein L9
MERMQVILLRRIAKLGTIGDVVSVKPGFARNYLLPKKFALRATEENMKIFEDQKEKIVADNAKSKEAAEIVAKKLEGVSVVLIRQASEKGQLYGSVTARDIAGAIKVADYKVTAGQVNLNAPIKMLGIYEVAVELHPEVIVTINLNVAKSEEDARNQA